MDKHLVEALLYLKDFEDPDLASPIMTSIRKVRAMVETALVATLPEALPTPEPEGEKQ